MSTIEWTEKTWNPVTGCSKVSTGCKHCYAERLFKRVYPGRKFTDVQCHPERLDQPLHWRKPSMVFVNSMSDLFHENVEPLIIAWVFDKINRCPQHTFQILTKRPEYMLECFTDNLMTMQFANVPNLWLGVSVENQETADERIPLLLQTPAAVRFVSLEPLLGPVDIVPYMGGRAYRCTCKKAWHHTENERIYLEGDRAVCSECNTVAQIFPTLDWIIVGGESGLNYRSMNIDWVRGIRYQCEQTGTPLFVKQLGGWPNKRSKLEDLPPDLRIREYPR